MLKKQLRELEKNLYQTFIEVKKQIPELEQLSFDIGFSEVWQKTTLYGFSFIKGKTKFHLSFEEMVSYLEDKAQNSKIKNSQQ